MTYYFFDIEVDEASFEVWQDGHPIPLTKKGFEVLLYLIAHRDRAVSRTELLETCWSNAVVGDGSLSTCVNELRRALGETGRSGRIIRTVHGRGYQFVGPLRTSPPATNGPAPVLPVVELDAPTTSGLLEREEVWRTLEQGLLAARRGRGGLLWLQAEPGMGKTALANATLDAARRHDMWAFGTATIQCAGAPPLWTWVQLTRTLAREVEPACLREAAGSYSADLRELAPHLGEALGAASPIVGLEEPERRFRRLDSLAQLLLGLAARRPTLVVLDDLHWADPDTLEVLELLGPQLARAPLCVFGLHRPVPSRSVLGQTVQQLRQRRESAELSLSALSESAAVQLVQGATHVALPRDALDDVVERGQGNPLFLLELARFAASEERASGDGVPDGIRSLVERRLARLPPHMQPLLRAAAVLGREIEPEALAAVCDSDVALALAALTYAAQEYLVQTSQAGSTFAFRHELLREAVYASMSPAERCDWHRRAADRIERSLTESPLALGQLGHHLAESGQAARAASVAVEYTAEAYRRGSHRAASELASKVLRASRGQLSEPERARLLLERARALAAAGAPYFSIGDLFRDIASDRLGALAPELLAEVVLEATGFGMFSGTARRQGYTAPFEIEACELALSHLSTTSLWWPLVAGWLANLKARSSEHCGDAQALAEEAVAMAHALGEPRIVCATLLARAGALTGPSQYHTRLALADQAETIAEKLGHAALRIEACAQRMAARLSMGQDCEDQAQRIEAIADDVQLPALASSAMHWRIGRALAQLDFARVRELSDRVHMLTRRRNVLNATLAATAVECHLRLAQGTLSNWRAAVESSARAEPDNATLQGVLLTTLMCEDDYEAGGPLLDELVPRLRTLRAHLDFPVLLCACARAACRLQQPAHARAIQAELAPLEDLWITETGALLLWIGPASYDLALLASLLRQDREAERLFNKALSACERLEAEGPKLVVATQRMGHQRRRAGDIPNAERQLRALRKRAVELNYRAQVAEVDALLREPLVGQSPSRQRGPLA